IMKEDMNKKRLPVLPGLVHEASGPDEKSYLIGGKCKTCGRVFFPKPHICSVCMKEDSMEEVSLSRKGTIDTFTVIHVAPLGFKAPYIQAFVDLPEGPRIFSLITGCDPLQPDLKDGAEMELVIVKIREDEQGNDLISYKFKPAGKRGRCE
ncbi:MAG TPA: Zn-ribbon domain-containing OB-fold protein, partial [Desulfobacteraceae bacterium]|nr:Zn-ribbon domain-containing OB-fold protein [Desulfobacteraceae bacterium]